MSPIIDKSIVQLNTRVSVGHVDQGYGIEATLRSRFRSGLGSRARVAPGSSSALNFRTVSILLYESAIEW